MHASPVDRFLRLFGDVRPREGARLMLLGVNLLLLLLAYYLLKTLREPLVLGEQGGGAEVKSYAAAVQAVVLVGVSLGFGWLASRLSRIRLLVGVTLFFVVNLVAFAVCLVALPHWRLAIGVAFFIWVGCFSVMIVAQFWAFANDIHGKEQGERLFPIIAGGSAIGAVLGARLAKPLFHHLGAIGILSIAAGILAVCAALFVIANRLPSGSDERATPPPPAPLAEGNGFSLMLRDRYLLFVGLLSFIKNWVNTTGEYILDRRLVEVAAQQASASAREAFIAGFKSDYFTYVNAAVMVLQFFAVSRIVRYVGVRRALFVLPAIALCSYSGMALVPLLAVIFVGKITENTIDYSLQKTVEQMLFLVTTREAKYKVKAIVDTFLQRLGDVASAGLVWVGAQLSWPTGTFIAANLALVAVWFAVVVGLTRAHAARESGDAVRAREAPRPPPPPLRARPATATT